MVVAHVAVGSSPITRPIQPSGREGHPFRLFLSDGDRHPAPRGLGCITHLLPWREQGTIVHHPAQNNNQGGTLAKTKYTFEKRQKDLAKQKKKKEKLEKKQARKGGTEGGPEIAVDEESLAGLFPEGMTPGVAIAEDGSAGAAANADEDAAPDDGSVA